MAELGFKELVPEQHAGHIITCFYFPKHKNFSFETFYQKLSDLGKFIFSIIHHVSPASENFRLTVENKFRHIVTKK